MIPIRKLVDAVHAFAPFDTCVEGDCVGLLVGDPDAPLGRVAVALDATKETLRGAEAAGCSLLLTHHPLYFGTLADQPADSAARLAERLGIAVLCAHTNLDAAPGGVNDCLAAALELRNVTPIGLEGEPLPMARVGDRHFDSCYELARLARDVLGVGGVKITPAPGPVTRVAVCGGSGGDFLPAARAAGAQALVTGESKHHLRLLARELGVSLIECGHFCTEHPVTAVLTDLARSVGAEVTLLGEQDPAEYLN